MKNEYMEAMKEMAENPSELTKGNAEQTVVRDSFSTLYESEMQKAMESGNKERVAYLESLRGKVAGAENVNHAGEISFGMSVDDMQKAHHAKEAERYSKEMETASKLVEQRTRFVESDARNGRSITRNKNDLDSAIRALEDAKRNYNWHKNRS